MKRWAWVWGAIGGAVALPLSMACCVMLAVRMFPLLVAIRISWPVILSLPINRGMAVVGAVFGGLSVWLWGGRRKLGARVLSAVCGAGVNAYFLWILWSIFGRAPFMARYMGSSMAFITPPVLWGLALLFFALLARPRRDVSS